MQFIHGDLPELEAFLTAHPYSSLWHTRKWADFQQNNGNPGFFFGVVDENGVILAAGILQIRRRAFFHFGYIQGGILYTQGKFDSILYSIIQEGLQSLARKEKLVFCLVDWVVPEDSAVSSILCNAMHHDFHVKPIIPAFTNILDISQTEEELLAQMKPKGRYNIKLAEKKGVSIREGRKEEVADFYHLLEVTTARDGFRANDLSYYQSFLQDLPFARFWVAEHENEIIAGGIFTYSGKQALYYYGASANHKRNLMAPYLLQWEALRYGKAHGCTYYDFMGIADPEKEDDPLAGVTDFKLKFGNGVTHFLPAYDMIFRPITYHLYLFAQRIRKRLRSH